METRKFESDGAKQILIGQRMRRIIWRAASDNIFDQPIKM
jgi:hypothetical protein